MIDVFTMSSAALPRGTRVVGFRGTEGMSRLYAFEIYITLGPDEAESFDLGDAVGAKASLVLDRQDGRPPFSFHGILSETSLVHHQKDGRALCRAVLVPRLWKLTQTLHSRIFTNLSIPDIIKKILDKAGLSSNDYALKLSQSYPVEEHVCQYGESDFDFISRWMEREGMYYFFEHGDDGEQIIIADGKSVHEDLVSDPIRYFALADGDATARESLHTFVCRRRSLPASVRFKDHDYAKPTLDVSGSAPVSKSGSGEISIHGARFFTPDAGKRLAKLRAEGMLSREVVFTGSGTSYYLRSGYTFSLQDHPRSSFDAKYLTVELEHYGNQAASTAEVKRLTGLEMDEVYRVDVTAIPHSVQFRAETRTSWPRIYGTEHGTVDGEADSEYAQLDDHGRYAVRFAFDESELEAGKASTRVRMMQPHGGGIEGWHFPLRKGTEVLFTFLGGDPDRPVIAGVVPTAHTPSPVTKSNHTRNVIQTGGRNRFELEDKDGQQRITLSTPHTNTMIRMGAPNADHNMIVRTDGRTLLDAGQDWDVTVGGKLTEDVKGDVKETYHAEQKTTISAGRTETILGGGFTHDITGFWSQVVNGNANQLIKGTHGHTVTGNMVQKFDGMHSVKSGPGSWHYANLHLTTDGPIVVEAPSVTIKSPDVKIDGATVQTKSGFWKGISGPSLEGFTTKNAIGVQKFDGTGVKLEFTSTALARVSLKVDSTGLKIEQCSFKKEVGAAAKKDFALSLSNIGAAICSFGFAKLG